MEPWEAGLFDILLLQAQAQTLGITFIIQKYKYVQNYIFRFQYVPCKKFDFSHTFIFTKLYNEWNIWCNGHQEWRALYLYESKLLISKFIFDHFKRQISINTERGPLK